MPPIKSLSRSSTKWMRQSSAATPEYQAGVEDPKTDWATATAAAEANYNKGVQAAITRKAFGKGVKKAGTDAWKEAALKKGVVRWAAGIALAQDKYEQGFAPFRTVIENTKLPPRGPVGAPENINRVAVMAKALHDEKIKQQG